MVQIVRRMKCVLNLTQRMEIWVCVHFYDLGMILTFGCGTHNIKRELKKDNVTEANNVDMVVVYSNNIRGMSGIKYIESGVGGSPPL